MPVIAFSLFVVVSNKTNTRTTKEQTVLEEMAARRNGCRNPPDHDLDERTVVPDFLGFDQQPRLNVLHYSNMLPLDNIPTAHGSRRPKHTIGRRAFFDPVRVVQADIAAQMATDEAEAIQDAARFARRVRKRLGLSQAEFSHRIDVSLDTIRNWEQGKRCPTGAAKALLKVLDKAPEAALAALD